MAIAATDTIDEIYISASVGLLSVRIQHTPQGGVSAYARFNLHFDSEGYYEIPDAGQRSILHTKAEAGELPTPYYATTQGETVDSLATFEGLGYNDPTDPASRARVKAAREAGAALGTDATTTTDATTGKPSIEFTGDLTQAKRDAPSVTVQIGASIWTGTYGDTLDAMGDGPGPDGSTGFFYIDISLEEGDPLFDDDDLSTYETHERIRAFVAIMNGQIDDLESVDNTDVTGGMQLDDWDRRVFSFTSEQMGGGAATSLEIVGVYGISTHGTQAYALWRYKPVSTTTPPISHVPLETWIRAQTVTLTDAKEPVEAAGSGVTVRAERIIFPSGNEVRESAGQLHIVSPATDRFNVLLGSESGRTLDVTTLDQLTGSDQLAANLTSYDMDALIPYLRTVYLPATGVTSDSGVRLPPPSRTLTFNATSVAVNFVNENDAFNLSVYDWDGELMFTVARDRYATVEFSFDADGEGRAQVTSIHPRLMIFQSFAARDFAAAWTVDQGGFTWHIVPAGSQSDLDADAFRRGDGSISTTGTDPQPFGERGFQVLRDGELDIEQGLTLRIDDDATGSATGISVRQLAFLNGAYSGAGNFNHTTTIAAGTGPYDFLELKRDLSVSTGEWFALGVRLIGSTIPLGDVSMTAYRHRLELFPHILVRET